MTLKVMFEPARLNGKWLSAPKITAQNGDAVEKVQTVLFDGEYFCTGGKKKRLCGRIIMIRNATADIGRGNSTKIPSPRMDPAERPTDPGRRN